MDAINDGITAWGAYSKVSIRPRVAIRLRAVIQEVRLLSITRYRQQ